MFVRTIESLANMTGGDLRNLLRNRKGCVHPFYKRASALRISEQLVRPILGMLSIGR